MADSHPEVARRVKQEDILFYSKHRYQQIGVHRAPAADGGTYNILYLATGTVKAAPCLASLPFGIAGQVTAPFFEAMGGNLQPSRC